MPLFARGDPAGQPAHGAHDPIQEFCWSREGGSARGQHTCPGMEGRRLPCFRVRVGTPVGMDVNPVLRRVRLPDRVESMGMLGAKASMLQPQMQPGARADPVCQQQTNGQVTHRPASPHHRDTAGAAPASRGSRRMLGLQFHSSRFLPAALRFSGNQFTSIYVMDEETDARNRFGLKFGGANAGARR